MKKIFILLFVFTTFTLLCQTAPNILWTRTFDSGAHNRGYSVKQTNDGGFIVSGSSALDTWLIKLDANGDTLWTNTFEGNSGLNGRSVQQTNDGGFAVIGREELYKTNSDGVYQWHRDIYYSQYQPELYSMQQTNDSGYILAGKYASTMVLIKTDEFGNEEWNNNWMDGGGIAYDVKQTSDNGYIIAGTQTAVNKIVLLKTDEFGDEEWNIRVGSTESNNFDFSVDITNDGGYILSGAILTTLISVAVGIGDCPTTIKP